VRTISSSLEAAQKSTAATPYIHIEIGGTDYSSRLLQIEHHEEAYRERAVVVLRNNDSVLSDIDLRGEYFEIGYGHDTSLGKEYKDTAGLWVKSQQIVSLEGQLVCVLQCEGMWSLLRELRIMIVGDPPYFTISYDKTKTIYELLELVFGAANFDLEALGDQDDGIISAFKPVLSINMIPFENCATVLYRLIYMTKCYLRAKVGKKFKIIYPQESDSIDEKYYSNKAHYFNEYVEKHNLVVPNKINVFCNQGVDGSWENLITGEAVDEDAIEAYEGQEILHCQIAADITNQADADNRAAAIMTRIKAEELAGRLVIPHDCRVELYDRVAIYDARRSA